MSDYYEHYPRVVLPKAVVLAGQLGCGAAVIGRSLTARTGLPFLELDRLLEHEAGQSLARLAFEQGLECVERRAEAILDRILGQSPRGVVVVDRAWPSVSVRDMLTRRACFVNVRRPFAYWAKRLRSEVGRSGDWVLGDHQVVPDDAPGLEALFAHREQLLAHAHVVLDAASLHPSVAATDLLESLEHVTGAEAL